MSKKGKEPALITGYFLVVETTATALVAAVTELIEAGWQPLGPAFTCREDKKFAQTMVLYEP